MGKVEILVDDYKGLKEGDLIIFKNGRWSTTSFDELAKNQKEKINKIKNVENKVDNLSRNVKHFTIYAKSHFMVVYNSFKTKVLGGTLEMNEYLVDLDEKVLNDQISVQDALNLHPYLLETFNKLFVENEDVYKEV